MLALIKYVINLMFQFESFTLNFAPTEKKTSACKPYLRLPLQYDIKKEEGTRRSLH